MTTTTTPIKSPDPGKPLQIFLGELDSILNDGLQSNANRGSRTERTLELLEAADDLYNLSSIPKALINDAEGFRTRICGSTRVTDIINEKEEKKAVVDLVQQGGTMLGIGLLGYTYIMEKAGVRFRNMAGTSAGAINTLLLSSLPEKIYKEESPFDPTRRAVKSELLAYLVANEHFDKFLDREGVIGRIQRQMVKRIKLTGKILTVLKYLLPLAMVGLSFWVYRILYHKLFNTQHYLTENQINIYNFITGTLGIIMVVLLVLVFTFGILRVNMGVNPGDKPYEWLKSILATPYVDIRTTAELTQRKKEEIKPTYTPPKDEDPLEFKDPRLVLITANLTHNRIVKFPENSGDYWNKKFHDLVSPAAFVRASMSLPFIFYAFVPDDKYVQVRGTKLPTGTVDMLARFVDGGLLSNFPIREFHTPPTMVPRYPTFGVLLGNLPPEPGKDTETIIRKFKSLSVFKFIVSFISTFRNFYDSDFLRSHKEFNMLVKSVNTDRFNSLDFAMSPTTKRELFKEGAKTAIDQLEQFNWADYLVVRTENP